MYKTGLETISYIPLFPIYLYLCWRNNIF